MFFLGPMTSSADSRMTEHSDSHWLQCKATTTWTPCSTKQMHIHPTDYWCLTHVTIRPPQESQNITISGTNPNLMEHALNVCHHCYDFLSEPQKQGMVYADTVNDAFHNQARNMFCLIHRRQLYDLFSNS